VPAVSDFPQVPSQQQLLLLERKPSLQQASAAGGGSSFPFSHFRTSNVFERAARA